MNFELEIVNKIKQEERELQIILHRKKNSPTISEEKQAYMEGSEKSSYIKGLRDALLIMQKNPKK